VVVLSRSSTFTQPPAPQPAVGSAPSAFSHAFVLAIDFLAESSASPCLCGV